MLIMKTNVIPSSRSAAPLPLDRQSSLARAPSSKGRRVKRLFSSFVRTTCPKTMARGLRTACATWLLPLLLTLPAVVQAQFTYTTNNGTITITGYNGSGGQVTIPSTTNGLPVTSIGTAAFYYCTNLTTVTIPGSVTNIGEWAFESCTSLTSVCFNGNAPTVGMYTFYGDNKAAGYYLPCNTGWSTYLGEAGGGIRSVLWKPLIQVSGASFGVRNNQFGFNITWASDMVVVVEACTNLASRTWSPVAAIITLADGASYFSDPQWTNYPARFYRLRSP